MLRDIPVYPQVCQSRRPNDRAPAWTETAAVNWPALVALVIAVIFGGYATGIMPGEDSSIYLGPAPLFAWILAGGLYLVGVGVTRAVTPNVEYALWFAAGSVAEQGA